MREEYCQGCRGACPIYASETRADPRAITERVPPPSSMAARPTVTKPPVVQPGTGNNIIINPCQRLNPVLEAIRNVGKEFGDILPDFQVGRTTGVLYLSLQYHRLHPEYIHQRIEQLGHSYNLRVLLLLCDISEHQEHIRELTKICLINNITIMVAWTCVVCACSLRRSHACPHRKDEAGQYLSTYKQFEHKPPTLIRERVERTPAALMRATLTGISKVNKTDVETLRTSFGSFANIARATSDQLSQLPGFGPKKVARMKDAFERPFRNNATSSIDFLSTSHGKDASQSQAARTESIKSKGKGKELTRPDDNNDSGSKVPPASLLGVSKEPVTARAPSPTWDIELDLNTPSPPPSPSEGPPPELQHPPAAKRPREESPVWDIELDLNDEEIQEILRETKRQKG
ncbi:hypothetical protein FA95DRAFT_1163032 [Auriscalpium vulgare]|uniref:Uncharacterized protein n=1 Tax=Auriscalpium vulgare TaxID=40419 RepID=A0ACB8SAF8_9AGAM|nr:hypothetical protein FA95DRAFT_1163032 [Auriscalpium vulgare]